MLDGWYCRSMASAAAAAEEEEQMQEESQCKREYKFLKRKLKNLIYENECFHDALKAAQKRLLIATRDRNFLLDRLEQYEKVDSSTESDETDSSDEESIKTETTKRKRVELTNIPQNSSSHTNSGKSMGNAKRKRPSASKQSKQATHPVMPMNTIAMNSIPSDGHMTPEEVERHLQSRQSYMELMPERAPPTVPTEMFSNEPSLDSESNDVGELETSPSNIGEELSVDMIQD